MIGPKSHKLLKNKLTNKPLWKFYATYIHEGCKVDTSALKPHTTSVAALCLYRGQSRMWLTVVLVGYKFIAEFWLLSLLKLTESKHKLESESDIESLFLETMACSKIAKFSTWVCECQGVFWRWLTKRVDYS